MEEGKKKGVDDMKKIVHWMDNPKFHISFDYKDRLPEVEFEVIISRSETIWTKKIANSVVNSMVGIYIFRYDKDRWRELCVNMDRVEFLPKTEIVYKFRDFKVDPKGYVIMPTTYGKEVLGPFTIMIKCKEKFKLEVFNPKKNQENV